MNALTEIASDRDQLVPLTGCWVHRRGRPENIGRVVTQLTANKIKVDFGPVLGEEILEVEGWRCGLQRGFVVQDVPLSAARRSLGPGTIVGYREIACREQVCVQFHETGHSKWLPFEQLVRIMEPKLSFMKANQQTADAAERTALNLMGRALTTWNDATGALSRLDIDPLPHQISLVHRIISSGTTNWIIADDVGLGKTIEVGLLLGALERRRNLRRVLIIVPSGLTRQWKDEMLLKFDRSFSIFGRDFEIEHAREWGLYESVITSLDLVKPRNADDDGNDTETRFGMLLKSGRWDLVIFDEAHRLSRDEGGRSTLRYKLAKALRERCDDFLMLTGTPHQGDSGKFQNLLRLSRPDLDTEIRSLDANPEIVREMIIRNRKIDAVDIEGQFLFHGLSVQRISVPMTPELKALERSLSDYLRRGYRASDVIGGTVGRAIGFVMTIYRKLASSSIYALMSAMHRRRSRLVGDVPLKIGAYDFDQFADDPISETSDDLGSVDLTSDTTPFFEDEIEWINSVLDKCRVSLPLDAKGMELSKLVRDLVINADQNLLIFTEYRATQTYLSKLVKRVTGLDPLMIHGGMTVDEKRLAVESFNAQRHVLISTEAGGEGLNLQANCHVMVNYDLPWNPARLSQRMGRLYRYGQTKKVIVLNFHAMDTIDNEILGSVMERLDRIVSQMAEVNGEFDERYHSEVLGELLERLDISELLEAARGGKVDRSEARIEDAINAARQARDLQDDILSNTQSSDGGGWKSLGAFTTAELANFIKRAAPHFSVEVVARDNPERFELRLPQDMRGRFPEFGRSLVIEATTRRGNRQQTLSLLDFSSSFVRFLVGEVSATEFSGSYSGVPAGRLPSGVLGAWSAIFQNDQGDPISKDLFVAFRKPNGDIDIDNSLLRPLFGEPILSSKAGAREAEQASNIYDALHDRVEAAVASHTNRFVHANIIAPLAVLDINELPEKFAIESKE
jgi:superfamily II DNA or RNA helicase